LRNIRFIPFGMDKDDIRKILQKKIKLIANLGATISKGFDGDNIHKFRVEVKRLRSFLRLLSTNKKKEIKLPKTFKHLYDVAGIIREIQLEEQKIRELKLHLPSYSMHLVSQMQYQKSIWLQDYKARVVNSLYKRIDAHKFNKIGPEVLLQFMRDHFDTIVQLNKIAATDNDIHSIRKQAKDVLYNIKFTELEWKDGYKHIKHLPLNELDKLSDSLGDYNDTRIRLEHFESYHPNHLLKEEKNTLVSLRKEERKLLQSRKKQIVRSVKKFTKDVLRADTLKKTVPENGDSVICKP